MGFLLFVLMILSIIGSIIFCAVMMAEPKWRKYLFSNDPVWDAIRDLSRSPERWVRQSNDGWRQINNGPLSLHSNYIVIYSSDGDVNRYELDYHARQMVERGITKAKQKSAGIAAGKAMKERTEALKAIKKAEEDKVKQEKLAAKAVSKIPTAGLM